ELLPAFLLGAVALGMVAVPALANAAGDYPVKPVRIVVPVQPGFTTDAVARLMAEKLRTKLSQAVFVENRAGGAGGNVGSESVARSAPDGYTLLVSGPGPLSTNKFLYSKLPFDPMEFVPVSLIASATNVVLVRPDSPIRSIRDLI